MILNYSEIKSHCYNAGFRGVDLEAAIKISLCESSWNIHAHNTTGEDSRGLFQINCDAHPHYEHLNLFDPQINCNIAFELYSNRGRTFKDWTCARMLGLVNPGGSGASAQSGISIDPKISLFAALAFGIGIVLYSLS